MDNQQTTNTVSPVTSHQSLITKNNFLVTLLSFLLLLFIATAGFFAYQTQNLVKQLNELKSTPLPTPLPTLKPTPKPDGFHGYNEKGKWFTLNFNDECTKDVLVTCETKNFKIVINPQAGGRGAASAPEVFQITSGSTSWERRLFKDIEGEYATYGFEDGRGIDGNYFLIEVHYHPYSVEAQNYFEDILSTFEFIEPGVNESPVACTMEAKICPDGSSVGRVGPNCEFSDCPN